MFFLGESLYSATYHFYVNSAIEVLEFLALRAPKSRAHNPIVKYHACMRTNFNGTSPSLLEPHCKGKAKCKFFIMKTTLHSDANKTDFH